MKSLFSLFSVFSLFSLFSLFSFPGVQQEGIYRKLRLISFIFFIYLELQKENKGNEKNYIFNFVIFLKPQKENKENEEK